MLKIVRVCPETHERTLTELMRRTFCASDIERKKTTDGMWWIVKDGNVPVGFACLGQFRKEPHTAYLYLSGVIEKYRGRGIQRRLMNYVRLKPRRFLSSDSNESGERLTRWSPPFCSKALVS